MTTASPVSPQGQMGEIPQAYDNLVSEAIALSELIMQLRSKLEPVSESVPQTADEKTGGHGTPYTAPLAKDLHNEMLRLSEIRNLVAQMIGDLAL